MAVLFISYDGLLEPLGQSQVLEYVLGLSKTRQMILVSYEKRSDWGKNMDRERLRKVLDQAGIVWKPLRYHKRPTLLATAYDIFSGFLMSFFLTKKHKVSIVHARSYVPSVVALMLKKTTRIKYVFDMRGFWADERTDGGLWQKGSALYQISKWFEMKFFKRSDAIISLTHAAVPLINTLFEKKKNTPIAVIRTCVNLEKFKEKTQEVNQAGIFVLGYVGSVGLWYLFDETILSFKVLLKRRPEAKIVILNRGEHRLIEERLDFFGVPRASVEIKFVRHEEIPGEMARMDAAVFFIKPCFSKIASSPTKMGELLSCGVPCLSNAGVGDVREILEENRVGVALENFESESLEKGMERLLALSQEPGIQRRCRRVAEQMYALEGGIQALNAIYQKLEAGGL